MSKLYKQYLSLKKLNPNSIILFKSGIFYIALDKDAMLLSEKLKLKLTNLNSEIVKCGFPVSRTNHYLHFLDALDISYLLIDTTITCLNNVELTQIITYILKLDFNHISFKDAFEILQRIQTMLARIYQ